MAKVKFKGDADRHVLGRLVLPGQVIDVIDAQVYGLTCSSLWEPHDKAAKDAHAAAEKAAEPDPEPDAD